MSKTIRRYSVPTLFSICLVLLLSLLIFHATDSAFAQTFSPAVTTASSSGERPHAATDGYGFVYLTYEEGVASVDFRKSSDSGATFSATAVNVETETGYFPRIAINNDEDAYVVYTFYEDLAEGNYWPRGFKSTNGAFTKILEQSDLPLTYKGSDEKIRCDIAVENIGGTDNVYVVWADSYNVANDFTIDFITTSDGGTNWTGSKASTPAPGVEDDRYPALAVKGDGSNDVFAAWVRLGNEVLLGSGAGRQFVKTYYKLSPSLAGFVSEKPLIKSLVRMQLRPWVKIAKMVISVCHSEE